MKIFSSAPLSLLILFILLFHTEKTLGMKRMQKAIQETSIVLLGGYFYTAAMTIIHEAGHAVPAKIFGWSPKIVLGSCSRKEYPSHTNSPLIIEGLHPFMGTTWVHIKDRPSPPIHTTIFLMAGPLSGLLCSYLTHTAWLAYGERLQLHPLTYLGICIIICLHACDDADSWDPAAGSDGEQLCRCLHIHVKWAKILYGIACLPTGFMLYKSLVKFHTLWKSHRKRSVSPPT